LSISVSAKPDNWIVAEIFRDQFLQTENTTEFIDGNELEATVDFTARFLAYISQQIRNHSESTKAPIALLLDISH
jgi:hypothetical protein